jgi:SLT domain-containing protein
MVILGEKESGGDLHAQNPSSGASGPWQLMPDTFAAYRVKPTDDIFNGTHNAAASSRYQKDRYGELVTFSPYTNGGIAMKPHLASVAERGPEFFMPLHEPDSARKFLSFIERVGHERRTGGAYTSGADAGGSLERRIEDLRLEMREQTERVERALTRVGIEEDSLRRWGAHAKDANRHNLEHDPHTREANARGIKNHLWMERILNR